MNTKPWHLTFLTILPQAFPGILAQSIIGRGLERGLWQYDVVNIRDYANDKHGTVDGPPAGGGAGMVLRADILAACIDDIRAKDKAAGITRPVIYMSPRGKVFKQDKAHELVKNDGIIFLCGRFEGVDERLLQSRQVQELSIGDYILAGGEVAAQVVSEACLRLIDDVCGAKDSIIEESFEGDGLLEYPQYTKPRDFEGIEIPEILYSGHHKKINAWRQQQALEITKTRRPDLLRNKRTKK